MKRISTAQIKQDADLLSIAALPLGLRRESPSEYSGPCPKCGGDDRFHVSANWWSCRQCHESRGDVIEYMQWLHGCNFRQACEMLTSGVLPTVDVPKPQKPELKPQSTEWFEKAKAKVQRDFGRLFDSPNGQRGREYLVNRGTTLETARKFHLGYCIKRSAITMPWFEGGEVVAIRYRLLTPWQNQKIVSNRGSRFGGRLFGAQSHKGTNRKRMLIICEGETNAISIYQAMQGRVNVLSVGSESATISANNLTKLKRWKSIIVWADKRDVAVRLMGYFDRAYGISSPKGMDANDLLQKGILGAFIKSHVTKSDFDIRILGDD